MAADSKGRVFNIEIQQESEGASPKRARYHSGLMDMNLLKQGQSFDKLPECHVIFITQDDVLGHGLPIYHIRRKVDELGTDFGDESQIIYVNSQKRGDTELGRLMHDMNCASPNQMYSKTLAARVRELKETQKGVDGMCKEVEELFEELFAELSQELKEEARAEGREEGMAKGRAEGRAEGKAEGTINTKIKTAHILAGTGMPLDKIAYVLETDAPTVAEWLDEGAVAAK